MSLVPGRMKPPFFKGRNDGLLKYLRRLCGNDTDFIYPAVSGDQKPCDNPSLDPMPSGVRRISGLHLPHDPRLHVHDRQAHAAVFTHTPPRAGGGSLAAAAATSGPATLARRSTGHARPIPRWSESGNVTRAGTFRSLPRYGRGSRGNSRSVGKSFCLGEALSLPVFCSDRVCGGFHLYRQRLFLVDHRRLL